jgi:outer membrane PBP1 activator LpoA protein
MSAYLQQTSGSQIHFFGTGGDAPSVLAAYFEAADNGADWIIGPLDRASVEALLNLAGLATPVLALNDLPDSSLFPEGLSRQVFGMSLSQEREAAAVAQHMADLGYSKAVLLAPENTWGERIAQAFLADFLQGNRQVLVSSRYLPEENDHSQVLERALQIDESNARKKRLEDRLGIELEFEAVRRGDVDAIFLAAGPEQGRLLAPQLRFFEAGDIPTFATSRVYTGRPDPARNQDLDGLTVPLTAWQLQHPTSASIPKLESLRQGEFAPFFAIGMDAWNILPWLKRMQSDPDFRFPGQSGTFSFSQTGNLQRKPDWARFSRGIPMAATEPPENSSRTNESR